MRKRAPPALVYFDALESIWIECTFIWLAVTEALCCDCEVVRQQSFDNRPIRMGLMGTVNRRDIYLIRGVLKLNVIYLQSFSKWQTLNIGLRMCQCVPLFSMILLFHPAIPNDETFVMTMTSHRDQSPLWISSEWEREREQEWTGRDRKK